ncbi:MAG TPA: ATP-binding protein [Bacteroidales bacterium]|nr:ATP-binding protein [Bacteroidales bacterium]
MKSSENIISGKYSLKLVLLVVLLSGVSLILGWLAFGLQAWITFYNVLILWLILLSLLLYHIRKINRDVARFFEVVQDQDAVQHFDLSKSDPVFIHLHRQMNKVIEKLAGIRNEKEKDYQFFRTIFDHADIGLLVYDEKGQIILINKAADSLLGKDADNISGTLIPDNLQPGKKSLIRMERNGDTIQLSLRSRKLKIGDKILILLSLQNIRQELEQHEVESWQKLIRVFIHEIMNSVSPITLTSTAIISILEKEENKNHPADIIEGLKAIIKRSKGISAFMDSYRQLSNTPIPEFDHVSAERMFDNVSKLMASDFQNRNIEFSVNLSPRDIKIWCDEKLIEHVLINLLKNSAEALSGTSTPEIRLSCVSLMGRVEIGVWDNGPGIDTEILENIFVPFFTTKPEGTGIGLSLSRQIMNLHGGSIFVNSKKGETCFTLGFPVTH